MSVKVRHLSADTIEGIKEVQKRTKKNQPTPKILGRQHSKSILVKLTEPEYRLLKSFAVRKKVSISDIVRSGITYIIENDE